MLRGGGRAAQLKQRALGTQRSLRMELWLKLMFGALALVLLGQFVARGDRALRARRWAPLIYLPLMLVGTIEASEAGVWWYWAAITLLFDQLAREVRLDWRVRHRRSVA